MSHAPFNLSTCLSRSFNLLWGVDALGADVATNAVPAHQGVTVESCCSCPAPCFLSHVAQKLAPLGDQ